MATDYYEIVTKAQAASYFQRPPDSDFIEHRGDFVLACHWSPWRWDKGLQMWIEPGTGRALPDPLHVRTEGQIPLEVLVAQGATAREAEQLTPNDPEVVRLWPTDGVAKRLRGDREKWRLRNEAQARYADRKDRARRWHPRMLDANPAEFITTEDRAFVEEFARNIVAQLCHLTTYLPNCQILAPKMAQRMCELVERELVSLEDYGKATNEQIVAEKRARGAKGVPEIDDQKIDKLERRRDGLRFQYHWCQMVFRAFKLQYDEVTLEYDTMSLALTGMKSGDGYRGYTSLRERVAKRRKDELDHERAVLKQLQMMETKSPQEYQRWLQGRTTYAPKHGQPEAGGEGADRYIARPMGDDEAGGEG